MATLYKTDGTQTEVTPKNGKQFTLEELQALVGGYIQVVNTNDRRVMVVDEEGKLKDKPYNQAATRLYKYGTDDRIVGDVVIGTHEELSG